MTLHFVRAGWLAALAVTTAVALSPSIAAPAIDDYGKLPAVEDAAISPSGNRVAMVATLGDTRTLVVMEGEKLLQSTRLGDYKVRAITWASDDILLADYSQTEKLYGFTADKAEFYRTIVFSMSGAKPNIVFAKQPDIALATFGWYGIRDIEGKTYGFFGGVPTVDYGSGQYRFEGGPPALYRFDFAEMRAKRVAGRPVDNEHRSWQVNATGDVGASLTRNSVTGKWHINNGQGNEVASGTNPYGGIDLLAFGSGGNSIIYYQEDEDSGIQQYFEVPLAGGEPKRVFADLAIDHFYLDSRSGVLLGYLESGDPPKPHFFDPVLDKKIAKIAKAFPKVNRHMIDWSEGFGQILLNTDGNADPGTWWTVDLGKSTAGPLGDERPSITSADVGAISTVAYKAADGLEMDGILTLPPGREPKGLPVVMLPHGGPTAKDTASFDWWAQAFAARGYAVFQPNFRGSTNRDTAFITAGHGEWGRKMQTDISDGLAHLAKQGIIDPKRACIVGASYGGYAALAGVTLQQGLYRCAVSVAGVADLALMVSTDIAESGSDPTLKRVLKSEIGSGRELKDVSPRRFADKADAPILLIHGKDDTVVPFRQSQMMADALKDAGKPFEFMTLAGEDHWLSRSATRLQMLKATIAFVEKHNPVN